MTSRVPVSHRSVAGAAQPHSFGTSAGREAAESGPVAQVLATFVLIVIWLLVVFLVLWPAWSRIWVRLAAAVTR